MLLLVDSCLLHSGYLGREFIIRDFWSNISKCNNHLWHMPYPIFGRVKTPIVLYSRYSDIGAKFGVLGGAWQTFRLISGGSKGGRESTYPPIL